MNTDQISEDFSPEEKNRLIELRSKIWNESKRSLIYEGAFGASPRDIRAILHRASEKTSDGILTPMILFEELHEFISKKSMYEFLQYKPDGFYHDHNFFLNCLESEYALIFGEEIAHAMAIADKKEYTIFPHRVVGGFRF